jgi:hypothetical protein
MSGKMFGMSGKFFWDDFPPPPVANISGKKVLGALFNRKVPLEAWPHQLLDASYAPGYISM